PYAHSRLKSQLIVMVLVVLWLIFLYKDTATTELYPLSLHDALPICFDMLERALLRWRRSQRVIRLVRAFRHVVQALFDDTQAFADRKSTRLNSSHVKISYAVFCLKKKKLEKRPFL